MKTTIHKSSKQGAIAIQLAVALGAVLLVMGIASAVQSSSSRSMLEHVMVYRLIDRAAASSFEEASALLEARFDRIEFPEIGQHQRTTASRYRGSSGRSPSAGSRTCRAWPDCSGSD